jgi:glycosyltransferase involved in cell wall biosynthesis
MRDVAIFRQNLFRISEPFITQQAQNLQRFTPIYLGRFRLGPAPDQATSLALEDASNGWRLPRIALQMATRNPAPYEHLLGTRRPILIHAHFGTDAVYALPLAKRLGIPLITTFHGFDATLSTAALLRSPAWVNYVLHRRQLAQQGDLFLCVSSFIREQVLAMGFPAARTHIHYTGVDCAAIDTRDPDEETNTILHVARLVEMKGSEYLLRAFRSVAQTQPGTQLVIIGDGPLRGRLHALVASLGLEGRVEFLGALPHAQALAHIRTARILVLPSVLTSTGRVEGLGMVLLEAAATGVPVIGSDVGGIPEGLIDGQTGFLVPSRDIDALARRMTDLLQAPALRQRMGIAARAFVERTFDLRAQNEKLENFYDAVIRDTG